MTSFHQSCANHVLSALSKINAKPLHWELLQGRDEQFIEADFGKFKLWIYDDMADIQGENISKAFELPDYKSQDDLISDFTNNVIRLLGC